jgi:hypothetical protein
VYAAFASSPTEIHLLTSIFIVCCAFQELDRVDKEIIVQKTKAKREAIEKQ